jgi:hypothetical protein
MQVVLTLTGASKRYIDDPAQVKPLLEHGYSFERVVEGGTKRQFKLAYFNQWWRLDSYFEEQLKSVEGWTLVAVNRKVALYTKEE